jgi:hypothetical protein
VTSVVVEGNAEAEDVEVAAVRPAARMIMSKSAAVYVMNLVNRH